MDMQFARGEFLGLHNGLLDALAGFFGKDFVGHGG